MGLCIEFCPQFRFRCLGAPGCKTLRARPWPCAMPCEISTDIRAIIDGCCRPWMLHGLIGCVARLKNQSVGPTPVPPPPSNPATQKAQGRWSNPTTTLKRDGSPLCGMQQEVVAPEGAMSGSPDLAKELYSTGRVSAPCVPCWKTWSGPASDPAGATALAAAEAPPPAAQ